MKKYVTVLIVVLFGLNQAGAQHASVNRPGYIAAQAIQKPGKNILARGDCDADFFFNAAAGNALQFDFAAVNELPGFQYDWNFGDGTAGSSGITASHTFAEAGIYTACLTASRQSGNLTCTECYEVYAGVEPEAAKMRTSAAAKANEKTVAGTAKLLVNPVAGGQAVLAVSAPAPAAAQLRISDLTGRIQSSGSYQLQAGLQTLYVNTGSLKPGTYLLWLESRTVTLRTLMISK